MVVVFHILTGVWATQCLHLSNHHTYNLHISLSKSQKKEEEEKEGNRERVKVIQEDGKMDGEVWY